VGNGLIRIAIELAALAALSDEVHAVLKVRFSFSTPLQRHSRSHNSIAICSIQAYKTRN
jgi:hypothetical protein